jgi:hypothetical protein
MPSLFQRSALHLRKSENQNRVIKDERPRGKEAPREKLMDHWIIHDGGWFKVRLVFGKNFGLGILWAPAKNQIGIILLLVSIVVTWEDSEQDDEQEDDNAEAIAALYPSRV